MPAITQLSYNNLTGRQKDCAIDQIMYFSQQYNYPKDVNWKEDIDIKEAIRNNLFNPDQLFIFFKDGLREAIVKIRNENNTRNQSELHSLETALP